MAPSKKIIYRISFALTLIFISLTSLFSQSIKFRSIGTDQGLSIGFVQCVLQDQQGFMWFGTQDGLNKFDGYEMKIFRNNPNDEKSLSNSDILCLFQDKKGVLWIGTNGGGLEEYRISTNTFIHHNTINSNLSNNSVRSIYEDKSGNLWVGTDNGLNLFDKTTSKFIFFKHKKEDPKSIAGNIIHAITETADGRLWIGSQDGGLNSLDKTRKTFTHYSIPTSLNFNGDLDYMNAYRKRVLCLFSKENDNLLVGTDGGGLGIFDTETNTYLDFLSFQAPGSDEINSENNRIFSIDTDSKGTIWMASYGGGLISFNDKSLYYNVYQKRNNDVTSLSSNDVYCVVVDNQDNIWLGTQNAGVSVYFKHSAKFQHIENNENADLFIPNELVFAILEDKKGKIWIGTDGGGILNIDLKNNTVTDRNEIISAVKNKSVLSLLEDKEGDIWIGTWGSGLYHYDTKNNKTTAYLDNDTRYATIVSLFQDSFGIIWIGTYEGGLFSLDKKTKQINNYTEENGLTDNSIFSLFEDSKHNLWIGTESGGACMKSLKDMTNAKPYIIYSKKAGKNKISSDKVFCFYEDIEKNFYIGTSNGLNKLDKQSGSITSLHESDGLPNGNIYGIIPDKRGNLWLTTNKGLSKYNPLIENNEGSAFRNFDLKDGLQGMEFNQGSFFKNKNGDIMIGGENGFNIFNPEHIKDNPHAPPVYITSYKRFGKEILFDSIISDKRYIELSYKDNSFSIDFVALDYLMPSENKFTYKLEGVDEDWTAASNFRHATYTQLKGGDYVLKIKAANSDGVWNDVPLELHITINPPWWKTKWFYTLSIIFITTGIFAFVRYRTAAIKKENRLLEQKVEERTFELAEKNRDILSSIQYAKRIQEAILPPRTTIFKKLPESFILYKPKDIVSGDFYWFGEIDHWIIIAAVDCTGHGVPGAFMSMIGHNLLNQIVNVNHINDPGSILTRLHLGVQAALRQGVNEINTADGMDVALCAINIHSREIKFAGANRSLVIVTEGGELDKIESNKYPIGGSQLDTERVFSTFTKKLNHMDSIYLFSDGYADQFGGDRGKKYMVKRFNEFLVSIRSKPMSEQGKLLDENIENWKGSYEQVDDILVIGIRL